MKRSDLRVAFVLGQNAVGGTETQARSLVAALRDRGVAVDVFLVDGSAGTDGLPDDTVVLSTGRPRGLAALRHYAVLAVRLHRGLRSGRYDVVHSAMARAYVLTAVATIGLRRLRHVSWRRNVGVHLDGVGRRTRVAEHFALRRSSVVVANSREVADFWLGFGGGSAPKCVVIPNLLEPWRFAAVEPVLSGGEGFRVVTVAGLKPEKGHRHLVDAVASRPELCRSVELIFVGDGAARRDLERQAQARGVRLTVTGTLPDPRPWLSSAQLYVHPSLSEGSSNAVAEAMAAGLPVVATRVGGMAELLGEAGLTVPPADPDALADAIGRMMADASFRADLARQARTRVAQRSCSDQVVDAYLSVYGADTCAG